MVLAIKAFGDGDYAETRAAAARRCATSRTASAAATPSATCIDLTLIEAAFRSGQQALAAALAAERAAARPKSPLARLFVQRAAQMKQAA